MLNTHYYSNPPKPVPFILLFVLMMCFALSTCERSSDPPPKLTPTPIHTPPPNAPSNGLDLELEQTFWNDQNDFDSTSNNNDRKPSLIIIVDRSNSMTKCRYPKLAFVHKIIISFLAQVLDKRAEVHVTELPRPDSRLSLKRITANNTLSENDLEPWQQGRERLNNHFQTAFRDIKNGYRGRDYIVLLMSDGAFNDEDNTGLREDMDRWLQENDEFKRNLFMLLWDCPEIYEPRLSSMYLDDKNMWQRHLLESSDRLLEIKSDRIGIDLSLDKLGEFLRKMIEHSHLNKALPNVGAGWLEPSLQTDYKLTNIPGYTKRITLRVSILSLTENTTAVLDFDGTNGISANISLGGQENTIHVPPPNPTKGCVSLTPSLSFNNEIYLGYYELVPYFFHDEFKPVLRVNLSTDDGLVLDKNHPTLWNEPGITLTLISQLDGHGGADRSKFNEYAPCYAFHIEVLLNGTSTFGMPANEKTAKQVWGKDDSLSVQIKLPEGDEGNVLLRFVLSITGEPLIIWESKDNIQRRYHPTVAIRENERTNDEVRSFSIDTSLAKSSPLDPDSYTAYFYVQDENKSKECVSNPVQDSIKIFNHGESIPVTKVVKDRDLIAGDDLFWIFRNMVHVRDYEKTTEDCNYRYLILQWEEKMPSYICDVKDKTCERADQLLAKLKHN